MVEGIKTREKIAMQSVTNENDVKSIGYFYAVDCFVGRQ